MISSRNTKVCACAFNPKLMLVADHWGPVVARISDQLKHYRKENIRLNEEIKSLWEQKNEV